MWNRALHRWIVPLLLGAFVYQAGACPCGCWEHSLWHLVVDRVADPLASLDHSVEHSVEHNDGGPIRSNLPAHEHDHGDDSCQSVMRAPMNRPGVRPEVHQDDDGTNPRGELSAALFVCQRTDRLWEYARHEPSKRRSRGGWLATNSASHSSSILQVFLL